MSPPNTEAKLLEELAKIRTAKQSAKRSNLPQLVEKYSRAENKLYNRIRRLRTRIR